jgi:hypothetical protein
MENNEAIILFPNTTATEFRNTAGVFKGWYVSANEGYVMHTTSHDEHLSDDEGNPTGDIILGYTRAAVFVPYNYDFANNPKQIYAQLESEIPDPEYQIHGGSDNDAEIMSDRENNNAEDA